METPSGVSLFSTMKIRIKRTFQYQVDAQTIKSLEPGIYVSPGDISDRLARMAVRMGYAEMVLKKKAPEDKLVKVPESKKKVARKPVRSRSTRAKPDK